MLSASNPRLIIGVLALTLVIGSGHTVVAQTANLQVTAQVDANCTLDGGTLAFGTYNGDEKDAEGSFTYDCTPGTHITLSLDEGSNGQGSRVMTNGSGGELPYELYADANHSDVWGMDTDGVVIEGTAAGQQTAQVFGRIAAGLQAPAGAYNDTVLITLEIN